ncbi:hypothetical protein SynBIOSU31_02627 [Synechococcus sp. BIOS-U3-1]|nr:hypothetical protein SynBIOSU31_02627 [Synechococcus sp. BIOS-U3-1]
MVVVETRPLRGGGALAVRRMLRHNAIEAWKRCRNQAGGSGVSPGGDCQWHWQAHPTKARHHARTDALSILRPLSIELLDSVVAIAPLPTKAQETLQHNQSL